MRKSESILLRVLLISLLGSSAALWLPYRNMARADSVDFLCTREEGSRVNLRTGPGTDFEKGLLQVGSGGRAIVDFFEDQDYSPLEGDPAGDFLIISEVVENDVGESWSMVGTNQWVAWVRSDFVCSRERE